MCGRVSMPPLAMEATRCSTSSGMFAAWAAAMKSLAMAASAMLMPPEAEPVMPASRVTVIASLTSGLGMLLSQSASTRKPGREAMTAPKPYSEAVFIAASSAPLTALLLPSASLPRIALKPNARTMRMPTSNAACTAQMAVSLAISVVTGAAMPGRLRLWVLPYHWGIQWVNSRFMMPTASSGDRASQGLGSLRSWAVSGSLRRSEP
ncbi:hypothetical protein D3C78_1178410 [compost metagenome]